MQTNVEFVFKITKLFIFCKGNVWGVAKNDTG